MAVFEPDLERLQVQLRSIAEQRLSSWRCVVGLDGPHKATVVRSIRTLIEGDERFELVEYPDRRGFYRHFERLLHEVREDAAWVALSDQDDRWHPQKLDVLVPCLRSADLALGQARVVEAGLDRGTTVRRLSTPASLVLNNAVTGCLSVIRHDVVARALPFPDDGGVAHHDHWLGLVAMVGEGIDETGVVVQDYVQHATNVTGEDGRSSLLVRVRRLRSRARASGLRSQLSYLSRVRWGWRVTLAAAALQRFEVLPDHRAELELIVRGRPLGRVLALILASVRSGTVPPLRGAALGVGATLQARGQRRHGR